LNTSPNMVKDDKMGGHAARMGEMRNAYKTDLKGRDLWVDERDNTRIYLTETVRKIVYWVRLAQDRDQ